jgi:hypothetical protein
VVAGAGFGAIQEVLCVLPMRSSCSGARGRERIVCQRPAATGIRSRPRTCISSTGTTADGAAASAVGSEQLRSADDGKRLLQVLVRPRNSLSGRSLRLLC